MLDFLIRGLCNKRGKFVFAEADNLHVLPVIYGRTEFCTFAISCKPIETTLSFIQNAFLIVNPADPLLNIY